MGKEIPFTEEIQPNYLNPSRSKSKFHNDNVVDSNRNIENKLGDKKLWLNDFEGSE